MNRFTKWLAVGLTAITMAGACWYVNTRAGTVEIGEPVVISNNPNNIPNNPNNPNNPTISILEQVAEPVKPPIPAFVASEKIPLAPWLQFKLKQIAEENDIPYPLAVAVIEVESTFRADAYNDGCYGLMQVSEIHAPREILLDPVGNMRLGCGLLGMLHRKYGDWHQALVAYNCGVAGAERYYFSRGRYSSEYSHKVLLASDRWAALLGMKGE